MVKSRAFLKESPSLYVKTASFHNDECNSLSCFNPHLVAHVCSSFSRKNMEKWSPTKHSPVVNLCSLKPFTMIFLTLCKLVLSVASLLLAKKNGRRKNASSKNNSSVWNPVILLMEEILHRLICSLSHYLQGFMHPRWLAGFLNHQPYILRSRIFCLEKFYSKDFRTLNPIGTIGGLKSLPLSHPTIPRERIWTSSSTGKIYTTNA